MDLNRSHATPLRRNPFLHVDTDRIRARSYFFWENQTGAAWWDAQSNWFEAEQEEILSQAIARLVWPRDAERVGAFGDVPFEDVYETIESFRFVRQGDQRPEMLGTRAPRRCSLCMRSTPDVTFRKIAHVIPESLGNKWLKTYAECDCCNENYGNLHDNELGSLLLAERAMGRVAKKGATARIALGSNRSGVGGQYVGEPLTLDLREGDPSVRLSFTGATSATVTVPGTTMRPLSAIKSIARMAWHVLGEARQQRYEDLRRWIVGDLSIASASIYHFFVPGAGLSHVGIALWENSRDPRFPELVALVFTGHTVLVLPMPTFTSGAERFLLLPPVPRAPVPPYTPIGRRLTVTADTAVKIGESSFGLVLGGRQLLTYSQHPVPVVLKAAGAAVTAELRTQDAPPASGAPVTYSIGGGRFAGEIRLVVVPDGSGASASHSLDLSAARIHDAVATLEVVAEVFRGNVVMVVHAADDRPLISAGGAPSPELAAVENSLALARAIAVIADEFELPLRYPDDPDEVDTTPVFALAGAITNGAVRYSGPIDGMPISITRTVLRELAERLKDGPADVAFPSRTRFYVLGNDLDVGRTVLGLAAAAFVSPNAVTAALDEGSPDDVLDVEVRCDWFQQTFERWSRE